ncbi:MAG: TIGR00730 family Rossman fold protein [Pleomorphochaeta sp.]
MNKIKNIAIFCGSSKGNSPIYSEAAIDVGNYIAMNDFNLIYGGGNIGLMGLVASSASKKGAKVIGVLPKRLNLPQVCNEDIETERIITEDMHERKKEMYKRSDAFIAMPGGIGTFEEFFESYTWLQLNIHNKPIGLLNIDNFYTPLYEFLEHACQKGFMKENILKSLSIATDIETLITDMKNKELNIPQKV